MDSDVEHVKRTRLAEYVGEAQHLERAQHGIVHAALHHDPDVARVAVEEPAELVFWTKRTAAGQRFSSSFSCR
jgi:hypothetical protein